MLKTDFKTNFSKNVTVSSVSTILTHLPVTCTAGQLYWEGLKLERFREEK